MAGQRTMATPRRECAAANTMNPSHQSFLTVDLYPMAHCPRLICFCLPGNSSQAYLGLAAR